MTEDQRVGRNPGEPSKSGHARHTGHLDIVVELAGR